jgi:hypothetical protein
MVSSDITFSDSLTLHVRSMLSARLLIATCVAIVGTSLACSSDTLTDLNAPPGLSLKLTPPVDTIFVTTTFSAAVPVALTLSATSLARPVVAPTGVEWTSSDPSIAVVTGGIVRAVATGTTIVTARVNGERATATIVVVLRPIQQPITSLIPSAP